MKNTLIFCIALIISGGAAHADAPAGMVAIPGGTVIGTDPWYSYWLSVSAFYMDSTEVTKAQWDAVYNWAIANGYQFDNPGSGKAANHPVHTVSWYDCVKWCNARSEMEGRSPCFTVSGAVYKIGRSNPALNVNVNGYRLPTNMEWSYATRGGLAGFLFPWGNTITHTNANYCSTVYYASLFDASSTRGFHPTYALGGYPYTSPVGSFPPNGYGLYDMVGNVWEWCWNASGTSRGRRGGSWYGSAYEARSGNAMIWTYPGGAGMTYGFRSVCH